MLTYLYVWHRHTNTTKFGWLCLTNVILYLFLKYIKISQPFRKKTSISQKPPNAIKNSQIRQKRTLEVLRWQKNARKRSSDSRKRSSDSRKRSSDNRKRSSDSLKQSSDSLKWSTDNLKQSSDSLKWLSNNLKRSSDSLKRFSEDLFFTSKGLIGTSARHLHPAECLKWLDNYELRCFYDKKRTI